MGCVMSSSAVIFGRQTLEVKMRLRLNPSNEERHRVVTRNPNVEKFNLKNRHKLL